MSVNTHKHQETLRVHYILSPTASDYFRAIWPTAFDTFQGYMGGIPFYPRTNSTKANNKNHLQKKKN